ncbi:hypothetical protein DEO72_LG7g841 [Vigna unguiculata]|uniref:Uncharacterized protein n=1 Tax=Vigna unguiculata TaxID=3917 RepID=A0A4D6MH28_VIGUN|nr:hypothetical protein DEO72_LG7g841 [Vigna unguiculata]
MDKFASLGDTGLHRQAVPCGNLETPKFGMSRLAAMCSPPGEVSVKGGRIAAVIEFGMDVGIPADLEVDVERLGVNGEIAFAEEVGVEGGIAADPEVGVEVGIGGDVDVGVLSQGVVEVTVEEDVGDEVGL